MSLSVSPVFNPSAKTLDFSAVPSFEISRLLNVTNITKNSIIYSYVGSPTAGGSYNPATKVLTLTYDTSTCSSGDVLRCDYESGSAASFTGGPVTVGTTVSLIVAARPGRKSVSIIQNSQTTVYFGNSASVTTSNGIPWGGILNSVWSMDCQGAIYGITASGSATLGVVETY